MARGPSRGRARLDAQRPLGHIAPHVRQRRFGERKRDVDRRDLIDGDKRRLIVGAHQIAGVDHERAGAAGDRRANGGVLELHLRILDRGAVGGERALERGDSGLRGVALLARDDAALHQLLVALHDHFRVRGLRRIAFEIGGGLLQRPLRAAGGRA